VGDQVFVLANGRQGRGEVLRFSAATGQAADAQIWVPAGADVIDRMEVARDGVYLRAVGDTGAATVSRVNWAGEIRPVPPPHTGKAWDIQAAPDQGGVIVQMDDLTWPGSVFQIDAATLTAKELLLGRPPSFETSLFTTTRLTAPSRDGEAIPVEILHRRDAKLNHRNPVLMTAYGAYGVRLDFGFVPRLLAFLEAGGVVVYAHVRGGGEKGEAWHQAGMKAQKHHTWQDAIDTAEHLIGLGWTEKRHLALWGTSAGGIMVGRAITERPDLFAAAIGKVGVFNALRFEFTANGPGNDAEFGTVKKEDEFHALRAMDACQAVRKGVRYPAVLLITGANDRRVESWVVGKFAAHLQAASTRRPGALLRVDYQAGHGASSNEAEQALALDMYSFVLANCR
jgi:prolyl oligopeptidase